MEPMENPLIPFDSIFIEQDRATTGFDMKEAQIHPFYELYFLLSGRRRYFIGGEIYNVSPGNLVVVPKNEIHKTGALNRKGWERYVVYFSEKSIEDLVATLGRETFEEFARIGCLQFSAETSKEIRNLLDKMYAEENAPDAYSYPTKKVLLYDLIIKSLRNGIHKNCATDDGADKIQQAAQYITENYREEITLESAAAIACMEKTYFSKRFKALTGFGFNTFLTDVRLTAAKELLASGNLNISEVSEVCGFSSSNYFGDVFAASFGCSPSQYRKEHYSK